MNEASTDDLLILTRADVVALLDHDNTLAAVRRAFEQHSAKAGRVFPLVREPIDGGAVFGIKSGDIAIDGVLGLKAAGFWPDNNARGWPAHQATILLVDPASGRAIGLFDGNHVTTLRTGAAGAIGLQVLARPDSTRLCLFGTGVQAQVQVDYALRVCPSLRELVYVTSARRPNDAFEQQFGARCQVRHAIDADQAVASADIVITTTPSRTPLFSNDAVRPGTHINAVGADTQGKRELPPGLLERCRLIVDDATQARQVGEAQWAPDCPLTEIGALLPGSPFDRAATDITVFDMTGLALQDLAVAKLLFDTARARGRGLRLPWSL